jgi:methylated-DNA-[protein]-cysteine S-methyltransferase
MHMCTRRADRVRGVSSGAGAPGALRWRAYQTRWGEGLVAADADGLRLVELPCLGADGRAVAATRGVELRLGESEAPAAPTSTQEAALSRWSRALEEYFRGERSGWSAAEIPWDDLGLRPFERAVYEALVSVPCGETVSYGRLAEMAGYPRAARAVGSAMAANPIPVIIPCHRVIRADGSLGNYGDDPDWKPRLLEHERAMMAGKARG